MNININEISKEEIKQILIEQLAAEILAKKRSKLNLYADEFNDDDVMKVGTEFIYDEDAGIETVIENKDKIIPFNIGGRF